MIIEIHREGKYKAEILLRDWKVRVLEVDTAGTADRIADRRVRRPEQSNR